MFPLLLWARGFLSLEINNAALTAYDVHVFLPHGDGFAVGEGDGGNQRFALRLDVSEIDFGQHVALAHAVALFDAGGEAFAAEFDGIHADMDEDFATVVAGEAVSVAGREGNSDCAAVWRDDGAVARFDGDAVAHAFRGQ